MLKLLKFLSAALSAFVPWADVAYAVDAVYAALPKPLTATCFVPTVILPLSVPVVISASCNAAAPAAAPERIVAKSEIVSCLPDA